MTECVCVRERSGDSPERCTTFGLQKRWKQTRSVPKSRYQIHHTVIGTNTKSCSLFLFCFILSLFSLSLSVFSLYLSISLVFLFSLSPFHIFMPLMRHPSLQQPHFPYHIAHCHLHYSLIFPFHHYYHQHHLHALPDSSETIHHASRSRLH